MSKVNESNEILKPAMILIPVENVSAGLAWYQRAFPAAQAVYLKHFDFTVLKLGEFQLEIVQADAKVPAAQAGTVLYWQVSNLNQAMLDFQSLGAELYRGPMAIEAGLGMCQMRDPFGNLLGLRGPLL